MFKKILCPVDFSDRSRGAAHVARAFSRRFHSEVLVLHVPDDDTKVAEAQEKLAEFAAYELEGCPFSLCVIPGEAVEQIVQFAHDRQVGLLIMAMHPSRKFELGSIVSRILYCAACPIWTTPFLEDWPPFESISVRSILCALDFGVRSCTAMNWAAALAENFGAKLTLAHVMPGDGPEAGPREEELHRQQQRLDVPTETRILTGLPAPVLSGVAEEIGADLMVIGRTHASSTGLGANAYRIIAHSPCPVLSV